MCMYHRTIETCMHTGLNIESRCLESRYITSYACQRLGLSVCMIVCPRAMRINDNTKLQTHKQIPVVCLAPRHTSRHACLHTFSHGAYRFLDSKGRVRALPCLHRGFWIGVCSLVTLFTPAPFLRLSSSCASKCCSR